MEAATNAGTAAGLAAVASGRVIAKVQALRHRASTSSAQCFVAFLAMLLTTLALLIRVRGKGPSKPSRDRRKRSPLGVSWRSDIPDYICLLRLPFAWRSIGVD